MCVAVKVAALYNRLLAFRENGCLSGDLRKTADDLFVAISKAIVGIRDAHFVAKFNNELLCLSKIVARHSREHVMNGLKLQATMDEVQPRGAVYIHGSSKHTLWKRLLRSQVGGTHGEVG